MIAPLAIPAGLVGALAVAAFVVAILGLLLAPAFARSRRWTGPTDPVPERSAATPA